MSGVPQAHDNSGSKILTGTGPMNMPRPLKLTRLPVLRRIPAHLIGLSRIGAGPLRSGSAPNRLG
jgi:hypothetical protein